MSAHASDNPNPEGRAHGDASSYVHSKNAPENPASQPSVSESRGSYVVKEKFDSGQSYEPENDRTVISTRPLLPLPEQPTAGLPLDQMEGIKLGHLELKNYLGGGMSAVYRAFDVSLARTVAVKILLPELKNEEYLRRFRNEAKNSARLDHENIARVYYIGTFGDLEYIVFEYVDGDNLKQLVQKIGPMSLDLAIRYTLQIAAAIQHAYQRDVTHRDVKPSNAIITKGGRVKLVDMGLARFANSHMQGDDVTSAGVTMGTFDYISPEQARDARSVDVRSDLYSLGCTMFFMLTGHPPYPDGTPIEKIMQHSSAQRPDPRVFRNDLPRELSRIVKKLLAPNPEMRYQTPDKLINDLMALAGGNQIQLYGFEQAMASPNKQGPSLLERVLPVAIPVALIISLLLGWEWMESRRAKNDFAVAVSANEEAKEQVDESDEGSTEGVTGSSTGASSASDDKRDDIAGNTRDSTKESSSERSPNNEKTVASDDPDNKQLAKSDAASAVDSSSTKRITGPPGVIYNCIVGGTYNEATFPRNSLYCRTVDEALKHVTSRKYPALQTIELQFNGRQLVNAANFGSAELDIRAAEGCKPVLTFKVENDLKLLRMQAGEVTFSGIHFQVLCPQMGIRNGITLFDIKQPQSLSLFDCSVTVVNGDESNRRFQDDVAVVRIQSSEISNMVFPEDAFSLSASPFIRLSDCVIRGDATLLKSAVAAPFFLSFDNGLLVTPQRMIELGGSANEPDMLNYDHPDIVLTHVTSITGSGLARMYMTRDEPFHRRLSVKSDSCIFKIGSGALIEHVNLDEDITSSERRDVLRLSGENNFLPENYPVWNLNYESGNVDDVSESLARAATQTDWFEQEYTGTLSTVDWESSTLSSIKPYHEQIPADYLITGGASNLAVRKGAGFDATRLKSIPSESTQVSTGKFD